MNRLTKKNNGTGSWTQLGDKYLPAHNIKHKQCVNKLGQLEDIEEEFGIDLFILVNNFKKDLEILECFKKIDKKELKDFIEIQIKYTLNKNSWLSACNCDLEKEKPTEYLIKIKEWLDE